MKTRRAQVVASCLIVFAGALAGLAQENKEEKKPPAKAPQKSAPKPAPQQNQARPNEQQQRPEQPRNEPRPNQQPRNEARPNEARPNEPQQQRTEQPRNVQPGNQPRPNEPARGNAATPRVNEPARGNAPAPRANETPRNEGRGPNPQGGGPNPQGGAGGRGGANTGNFQRGPSGRPVPNNARVVPTRGGGAVVMRSNGRPAVVHAANGVEIQHNMTGRTMVVREQTDHTRVVVERGGYGYVQHPYAFAGHPYVARTYYVGGRPYESFYRGYQYHGVYMEVYAPARYYPVGFYAYVGRPWAAPISFTWGWSASPWYGYYGGYFRPYPVYTSPDLWLTDYLISQSLAASYQAQVNNQVAMNQPIPPPAPGQVYLTPEVKQAIADEVRNQIALESSEAQGNAQNTDINPATSGIGALFDDNRPHVFVVGDPLDAVTPAGQECPISEGDVLQLAGPPEPDATTATLIVMASKGGAECRQSSSVVVGLADLQNMQDHMRQTLDQGLADLQSHQNGLPAPPQQAQATAIPAVFSTSAPPPDQTVQQQLNQQYQQGANVEQQTLADAGSAPPVPAPAGQPGTIALGQTPDQVTAILGQPANIVDLGSRKMYVYANLKITFTDGQVSDVQ